MSALLDVAAACTGVPREFLSVAKPPTVGSKLLTPSLLAGLKWDDPKLLGCPKVGSHPMQLRDGDALLFRDAKAHAAAICAADEGEEGAGGPASGGRMLKPSGTRGVRVKPKFAVGHGARQGRDRARAANNDTVVVGGRGRGGGGGRQESGVKIRTVFDAPPPETQQPWYSAGSRKEEVD